MKPQVVQAVLGRVRVLVEKEGDDRREALDAAVELADLASELVTAWPAGADQSAQLRAAQAEALAFRGVHYSDQYRDHEQYRGDAQRAYKLAPHNYLSGCHLIQANTRLGIQLVARGQRYHATGLYAEADALLKEAMARFPGNTIVDTCAHNLQEVKDLLEDTGGPDALRKLLEKMHDTRPKSWGDAR